MTDDNKILLCISHIEIKCHELTKLTNPKDRVDREYSMLAQQILNKLETLRKKQSEREQKQRNKEDELIQKQIANIQHVTTKKSRRRK